MEKECAIVLYNGRVQGIGFRYTCRYLAKGFSITGYVKNLEDGCVELVAEGSREEINRFLQMIDESDLKPFIRHRTLEWQSATGKWTDFHVVH